MMNRQKLFPTIVNSHKREMGEVIGMDEISSGYNWSGYDSTMGSIWYTCV